VSGPLSDGAAAAQRAHANFRVATRLALGFVALLWFVQLLNWLLGADPGYLGVRPRRLDGLPGIVFAPILHGDAAHLIANTPPLLVLGVVMLTLYPASALRVLPAIYFGSGIAVWLFARGGSHIGASGLVYGLAAYLLVAGLLRRDRRPIGAMLLVSFLYGSLLWGIVPLVPSMSWETHLAAALIGAASAVLLRRLDPAPPVRSIGDEDEGAHETGEPTRDGASADDPTGSDELPRP